MALERWTIDDIIGFGPCYPREQLEDIRDTLFGGCDSVTPLAIAECKTIPENDRIWLLCQSSAAPAAIERIVTRAVRTHCVGCGIESVETWAAKWLSGEDRSVVSEAAAAARAAEAAAAWAAWAEAAAAWAAWAEAARAERELQIQDFIEVLKSC